VAAAERLEACKIAKTVEVAAVPPILMRWAQSDYPCEPQDGGGCPDSRDGFPFSFSPSGGAAEGVTRNDPGPVNNP